MILAEQAHLHTAAATHAGMRGKANEDRYLITAYQASPNDHTPSLLAVLADGIGGHRAGEVAAQLAIENISKFIANSPVDKPALILTQALTHTNQLILNFANANPSLTGMGTTCVCAWVVGDQLYAASVGDSRLYLQRAERLFRLTTDHTWIQEALSQGTLTPEQARSHPNAHIIRRFLGSPNAIQPDLRLRLHPAEDDKQSESNQGLLLMPGDRLMLCTDGLTDLVMDGELREILRTRRLEQIPNLLVDLANQRGGHDNITVVMLEVPPTAPEIRQPKLELKPSRPAKQKTRRTAASWWMIGMLLIAILCMILLFIYLASH